MKSGLPEDIRYRHARHVAWRRVESEVVVLDLDTSLYYSLNETGARIWECLGKGFSLTAIADTIKGEFDGIPGKLAAEMDAFIAALLADRLLEPADS